MPEPSRRVLLAGALGAAIRPMEVGRQYPMGRAVVGTSTHRRPIRAYLRGDPDAPSLLVVGCIHGNERAGIPIARALLETESVRGVRLVVVPSMNPDGAARRSRHNARGVDLNRNFPGGRRGGRPGEVYFSGPRDLSEVESRVMRDLIVSLRPAAMVVYHQSLDLVDPCGGDPFAARAYAAQARMRVVRLPRHPGSMATWLNRRQPDCTILTVELSARVSDVQRARHLAALDRLQLAVRA
jgi:succinylglutamate desuccinylase